jgi:putative flippase GtrA
MIYQTSKQLIKFGISGLTAASIDFFVYYSASSVMPTMAAKALGFLIGTYVTYNLNKHWTWRKKDQDRMRVAKFIGLYAISMVINVMVNEYSLSIIPNNEFLLMMRPEIGDTSELFALKLDKVFAFGIATVVSSIVNFLGQKFWVFNQNESED